VTVAQPRTDLNDPAVDEVLGTHRRIVYAARRVYR
jgi:hypothetical protein